MGSDREWLLVSVISAITLIDMLTTRVSRRDAAEMSEIDLLFIHHSQGYLHPPSVSPLDNRRRREIKVLVEERILDTLQSRGMLGEQFHCDHATTDVMIRVPSRTANGSWETARERLQNIGNRQGEFHFSRIR